MKKTYIVPTIICGNPTTERILTNSIVLDDTPADPNYPNGGEAKDCFIQNFDF